MKHHLANIHPNAKIGKNVVVEAFATIYENVEIGEGTWIAPNAVIMSGARIGKNCKIFPGAVVSGIPQDLKFAGEETLAIIGDNTVIRECATISRGTAANQKTVVGNNCLIMAYVHVAHDCIIGNHCIFSNAVQIAGHVEIDDYAILGGTSAVHQFVRIGKHVMVPGGGLVRQDIPPYVTPTREPMNYAGINSVGLRRRGFSEEQLNTILEVYRHLYQKGMNTSQAITYIETEMRLTPEVVEIINFVKKAERGIIRANKR